MSSNQHMGGCSCGRVRYRMHERPLIVHACHCRMCQRLSGSTNAVNVLIEAAKVEHLIGETIDVETLTPSGHGQVVTRCKACHTAVWSEYRAMTALCRFPVRFIRAGTLDQPDRFPPDVHIHAETMQPHFGNTGDTPTFAAFYDLRSLWPRASLDRLKTARARASAAERPQGIGAA